MGKVDRSSKSKHLLEPLEGKVKTFLTGGFTPDAKTTARISHVHVELIDLQRFIDV